jgi:hypothetical protein
MEEQHILDISNELHMQVLHFILPRMQLSLERLKETLKRRPLRTENNRSPLQLWVSGQHLDPEYDPQTEVHKKLIKLRTENLFIIWLPPPPFQRFTSYSRFFLIEH